MGLNRLFDIPRVKKPLEQINIPIINSTLSRRNQSQLSDFRPVQWFLGVFEGFEGERFHVTRVVDSVGENLQGYCFKGSL